VVHIYTTCRLRFGCRTAERTRAAIRVCNAHALLLEEFAPRCVHAGSHTMPMPMRMILCAAGASVEVTQRDASHMSDGDVTLNRSYWRSRRGLLELDLLLPPFVAARYGTLSDAQRAALQRLLDCEDQDIWDWFQRRRDPADGGVAELLALIREFNDRRV
jgi:antitoxin CptB